ncbi:hypothetical protein MLD38_030211 [Melastoma candidum]|uniref:Uncharacterized protein n=1 Tax=Melastoma candidum TaxID=119954 RepID=A0ACB9MMV5_9MYRT|nr:hypothetical protein MLD38_030211 [Melastoma candidum]
MAPAATATAYAILTSVAAAALVTTRTCSFRILCGPRGERGPLIKGRTLSKEAILAIQALKRSPDSTANLSRLIKSDLVAALKDGRTGSPSR